MVIIPVSSLRESLHWVGRKCREIPKEEVVPRLVSWNLDLGTTPKNVPAMGNFQLRNGPPRRVFC
jgi:hypothetical protein